jgi:cytochrome o ubiquinol oxidase subunit 2
MDKKQKIIGVTTLVIAVLALAAWYLHRTNIPVLEPRGTIAVQEKHLLIVAFLLMLIVVLPVFAITFFVVWRYRETNQNEATYTPDWDHSRVAETIWWLIPTCLIVALSILTWNSTHALDPYKPLKSNVAPVTIQAVALDWKWLFIYPQQHIATVNYVEFPVNTPVAFQITADAPMNSLWIPQLAGQIYAMPGMETQLHLSAFKAGSYYGSSANISGTGFAGMHFQAVAANSYAYDSWLKSTQSLTNSVSWNMYQQSLSKPSKNNVAMSYGHVDEGLFNQILNKYMSPSMVGMEAQ